MSPFIILHGVRTIQGVQGHIFLVDEVDYPKVSVFRWHSTKSKRGMIYAHAGQVPTKKKPGWCLNLHRLLMDAPPGLVVDHKNGDPQDNRRDNLRICTYSQNQQNSRVTHGKSKYKGVSKKIKRNKCNKWKAAIMVDGKRHERRFADEKDAARWYDAMALEHFGEFACTNAKMFGDL